MRPTNDSRTSPESLEAFAAVQPTKPEIWAQIIAFAVQCGRRGFTCDELITAWCCSPNHIAPRCTELVASGDLIRTKERRITRSGCFASVLIAEQFSKPNLPTPAPAAQPQPAPIAPAPEPDSLFGDISPDRSYRE